MTFQRLRQSIGLCDWPKVNAFDFMPFWFDVVHLRLCSRWPLIIDRQRHRLWVSCIQMPVTEATSEVPEASACQPLVMHSLSVAQGHFGIEASGDVWIELTDLRTADMLGLFNNHPSFIKETRRPLWSPSVCDGVSPRVLICLLLSCLCSCHCWIEMVTTYCRNKPKIKIKNQIDTPRPPTLTPCPPPPIFPWSHLGPSLAFSHLRG